MPTRPTSLPSHSSRSGAGVPLPSSCARAVAAATSCLAVRQRRSRQTQTAGLVDPPGPGTVRVRPLRVRNWRECGAWSLERRRVSGVADGDRRSAARVWIAGSDGALDSGRWQLSDRAPARSYALSVAERLARRPRRPRALSWSAGWHAASTRRRIEARWRRAESRSPCLDAEPTSCIRRSTRRSRRDRSVRARWSANWCRARRRVRMFFPAAQPHHQRPVARRRRHRGGGEERVAHHRPVRARAGPRRARRARKRAERTKPRRARAAQGRCQACRDGRGYPRGTGLGPGAGPRAGSAAGQPPYRPGAGGLAPGRAVRSRRNIEPDPGFRSRSCCRDCSSWNCGGAVRRSRAAVSSGLTERVRVTGRWQKHS